MPYIFSLTESTSKNVSTSFKAAAIVIPIGCFCLAVAYVETRDVWNVLGWGIFEDVVLSFVWLYVIYNQNARRLSYMESISRTRPATTRTPEPDPEPQIEDDGVHRIKYLPDVVSTGTGADRELTIDEVNELVRRKEEEEKRRPAAIGYPGTTNGKHPNGFAPAARYFQERGSGRVYVKF